MYDFVAEIFQERLLHFAFKPVGDGDDGHFIGRDGAECVFLVAPVFGGAVYEPAFREFPGLGALAAAVFPFVAICFHVVIAVPGKKPTVMDCPDDRFS